MKLVLHIGLGKTGSSAIQAWLGRNAKRLKKQSIFYADLDPNAKFNKITSGNGTIIVDTYLKKANEHNQLLTLKQYINEKYSAAIISTESFHRLKLTDLLQLKKHCDTLGIKVEVIAYLRSVYEWAYSGYLQGVKRHGYTHSFNDIERFAMSHQKDVLERFDSVFEHNLIVRNYDTVRSRLLEDFTDLLACDKTKLDMSNPSINRSLTFAEANALRRVNQLHDGCFSFAISDYIIYRNPNANTSTPYVPSVLEKLEKQARENVEAINKAYFSDAPKHEIKMCRLDEKQRRVVASDCCDYEGIIEWALEKHDFRGKERRSYINFLRDLSLLIEEPHPREAKLLIDKALVLRPEGPSLQKIARRLKHLVEQ